jgi:hypothetical protein
VSEAHETSSDGLLHTEQSRVLVLDVVYELVPDRSATCTPNSTKFLGAHNARLPYRDFGTTARARIQWSDTEVGLEP